MNDAAPDMKIRVSTFLRSQIEEAARINNLTMNAEIIARLDWTFSQDYDLNVLEKGGATKPWSFLAKVRAIQNQQADAVEDRLNDLERRVAFLEMSKTLK